jgi:hypothetical protein
MKTNGVLQRVVNLMKHVIQVHEHLHVNHVAHVLDDSSCGCLTGLYM